MEVRPLDADAPEQLVQKLARKLRQHALWDAFLIFLPPLAAIFYSLFHLHSMGRVAGSAALLAGSTALVALVVAALIRSRPALASPQLAARLIDDRAGAQDRFLTLATLEPSPQVAPLRARLRREAAALQARIALGREFPYRIKQPFYISLLVSLAVAVLFQLLLPLAHSTLTPQSSYQRLREVAREMAGRPQLQAIGRSLQELGNKLTDPAVPPEQKRDAIREQRETLQDQKTSQLQQRDRELLTEAAGTLESIERQSGAGERNQDQQNGSGSIQTNASEQGQGDGREKQASETNGAGDGTAELQNELQRGQLAKADPREQTVGKAPQDGSGDPGQQPDPGKRPQEQSNTQQPGNNDGPGSSRNGRSKAPEEIPPAGPPAERFYKPGEDGYQGIKGAGYVTVQLPEELVAEGKGGSNSGKAGKSASSQVPVSNVPLPRHIPDAPAEKQQIPLEYRDLIR
jgi:hypothetical protein